MLATVELLDTRASPQDAIRRLYFFARDHLKIMRNGVPELDPVRAAQDYRLSPHSSQLFKEKWAGNRFPFRNAVKEIIFDCSFEGIAAVRCLEFSALDRVIYNLVNNAIRHGVGAEIGFSIFIPRGELGGNVRFVVQNPVTSRHIGILDEKTRGDLRRLFLGGLSTTGSGLGLQNCAEFVQMAFALSSDEVIDQKYIGAQIIDDKFVAWFHWPKG